jgi:cell division protein FtsQ
VTAPVRGRRPAVLPAGPRLAARAAAERRTRRSRLLRHGALAGAAAGVLSLLAWLVLASPVLDVDRVVVTGTSRLDAAQVQAVVGVPAGTPLAHVDTDAVRRRVAALPAVADALVGRAWPGTLRVVVTERTPVAGAPLPGGRWELVDTTGTSYETVDQLPAGAARLEVADTAADRPAAARAALAVLGGLPPALREQVASARAASATGVVLVLADGRTVLWGDDSDGAVKAATAAALLQRPGKQVDVSTRGLAVVR